MTVCPFCHFSNEDGALFCEQCKSDLAGAMPAVAAEPVEAVPVEAVPVEAVPVDAVPVEAEPVMAEAVVAEAVVAEAVEAEAVPVEAVPVEAVAVEAVPVAAEPVAAVAAPPAAAPAMPAAPAAAALAADAQPRLVVMRGLKRNAEYPVYEGLNFIGRADDKPVDIDLEDQEPPDRIWCSRQHACISLENGVIEIEDLNSANGTYVNRQRIYPGQKRPLVANDIIQIGNVQMKVMV